MKKIVIFDLDGTLLNTIADLAAATNYALTQFGYPTHDTDAYRFFVGNGINKLFLNRKEHRRTCCAYALSLCLITTYTMRI
jgi:phosphoglycolate phosphatase-like HAD superfamily hydrolase